MKRVLTLLTLTVVLPASAQTLDLSLDDDTGAAPSTATAAESSAFHPSAALRLVSQAHAGSAVGSALGTQARPEGSLLYTLGSDTSLRAFVRPWLSAGASSAAGGPALAATLNEALLAAEMGAVRVAYGLQKAPQGPLELATPSALFAPEAWAQTRPSFEYVGRHLFSASATPTQDYTFRVTGELSPLRRAELLVTRSFDSGQSSVSLGLQAADDASPALSAGAAVQLTDELRLTADSRVAAPGPSAAAGAKLTPRFLGLTWELVTELAWLGADRAQPRQGAWAYARAGVPNFGPAGAVSAHLKGWAPLTAAAAETGPGAATLALTAGMILGDHHVVEVASGLVGREPFITFSHQLHL